jgi:hypothetical protein
LLGKWITGWKAVTQLGAGPVLLNALYRFGLRVGHFRRVTPGVTDDGSPIPAVELALDGLLPPDFTRTYAAFAAANPLHVEDVVREAREICAGQVRLFGGDPVALQWTPAAPLLHWTAYEGRPPGPGEDPDIKMVWEPARFGWALTLARAYLLTADNGYAQYFWEQLEQFLAANPPNLGPNWASGQEVALRLISLALAASAFRSSTESTPARMHRLARALARHAARIPPTLLYARAQNNNHLLTEAAGLLTAAAVLPALPQAREWQRLGWAWLERGLLAQIGPDGVYAQHSANYHRLMLQTALWARHIARGRGVDFSPPVLARLSAATRWLLARIDPVSGGCLNLGSNDGAYILPLASGGNADYRPVAQAAALSFLGQPAFPPGAWDEFSLWLGLSTGRTDTLARPAEASILCGQDSWASLRALRFPNRPSQADQLHVDLWWRGTYIARDAGSYRYTAPAPWDNSLALTRSHNTVSVDGQEQMRRAGRFLWLDWAQARVLDATPDRLVEAEHDGYRRRGVIHRRRLERLDGDAWQVTDWLLPTAAPGGTHRATLHWLLPDWDWELDARGLTLQGPPGSLRVDVALQTQTALASEQQLIRCGGLPAGQGQVPPTLGWWSPTYNQKLPALSLRLIVTARLPLQFVTTFRLQPTGE